MIALFGNEIHFFLFAYILILPYCTLISMKNLEIGQYTERSPKAVVATTCPWRVRYRAVYFSRLNCLEYIYNVKCDCIWKFYGKKIRLHEF